MARLLVDFAWAVVGPFVTAGAEATQTLDTVFHRDHAGGLCVGKGHVKGKFLEAALTACDLGIASPDWVHWWFGRGDLAEPRGERLFFSDLRPSAPDAGDAGWGRVDLQSRSPRSGLEGTLEAKRWPRHFAEFVPSGRDRIARTAIGEAGTAAAHTLRVTESQPRGLTLLWSGRIETDHPDVGELEALAAFLYLCAARVETLGAYTGSGYGRVQPTDAGMLFEATVDGLPLSVEALERALSTVRQENGTAWSTQPAYVIPEQGVAGAGRVPGPVRCQDLVLVPLEPICVLDRKRPDAHFASGPGYVTGAVIKGALAAALNRQCGCPLTTAIGPGHPAAARYPDLCSRFADIRVLHALPLPDSWHGEPCARPLPVPLSSFADGKRAEHTWDAALAWDEREPAPGVFQASFAPDCDQLDGYVVEHGTDGGDLGAYVCAKGTEVRVAIDPSSGSAASGQLFGYDYLAEVVAESDDTPRGSVHHPAFAARLWLPDDEKGLSDRLLAQLDEVLPSARLGKTNAAVSWSYWQASTLPLEERLKAFGDDPVVLTLATDALLPIDTDSMRSTTDMTSLYDEAWGRVWRALVAGGAPAGLSIADVFARQGLRGGWIGRRGREGSYRAFCLTLAGSVFATSVPASDALRDPGRLSLLRAVEERGIPVTEDGLSWRTCPYVPENGFGEVVVCSDWHLARRPAAMSGEAKP